MPLQAQGEFALVKEKLEPALELSGQPVKRGTMAHKHIVYMMLTESAAELRDAEALKQYSPLLEELALRDGHQPYLAVAHRAWGVAHRLGGQYAEAGARLTKALELFGDLELHWQIGRTHTEIAELALAQSDRERSRDHLARALAEFELMHAMPDIQRTRAALEALDKAESVKK